MLAENSPIAHMGVVANKHIVVMHYPSLITHSYNPHDRSSSRPDTTVGKLNDMAIVGFKDLNLHVLNAYNFST